MDPLELVRQKIPAEHCGLSDALLAAGLPVDDLRSCNGRFFAFESDGATLGYGGYELYGELALVRSIVVLPSCQGSGVGCRITKAVLAEATREGARSAFIFTTSASKFFEGLGFQKLDRSEMPAAIGSTGQASKSCLSATFMCCALDPQIFVHDVG